MSTAATRARSRIRDVFFYDLQDSCAFLGGLVLTRGITNVDFYTMVGIVIITSTTFFLQDDNGQTVPNDAQPLSIGNYFVVSDSPIYLNDEQIVMRTISLSTGTRQHEFREQVRQRDGRCVVSKVENVLAEVGVWTGFEAAHIFPLSHEHHWQEHNYGRWITLPPSAGGTINSVQNGLLLQSTLHQLFDNLFFSINPDDNYKIVFFLPDNFGYANTFLDQRLLDHPQRPADQLLRWHFRQAVLANLRGAGEPIYNTDFPPGSDILQDIRNGPKAAERMEAELFGRFAAQMEFEA